ncbi:MAG TPA: indole-3-glycerol phosphate synthase TrpC [Caulobacteraceae bacterium]|jgi:indole-3-glycerol phosphate synthase|nr:indole-3-glycerol phosphate synthase TrpC [Caulobacteraceae bacterium]
MSDILQRIGAYKREEVAQRRRAPDAGLEDRIAQASAPRGFRAALQRNRGRGALALIAEVKRASPSKGLIRADFDPVAIATAYERGGASCLSVLTDRPSFQGCEDHLLSARDAVALPCLRKDFLVDPWQVAESRALGADAVLVILALVGDGLARQLMDAAAGLAMDVLVETHDEAELDRALALDANLIGINNRDLRTFHTDLATTDRLMTRAPAGALIVTESGIFSPADVERLARAGASAMLVGESLMRQADVEQATKALLAADRRA